MTRLFVIAMLLFASSGAVVQEAEGLIYGQWLWKERGNAVVEFFKAADGTVSGKVVSADDKEMVGKLVFYKIVPDKAGGLMKGRGDAPIGTIDIVISFPEKDALKMVGKKMLFSKTFTMTRLVKSPR